MDNFAGGHCEVVYTFRHYGISLALTVILRSVSLCSSVVWRGHTHLEREAKLQWKSLVEVADEKFK